MNRLDISRLQKNRPIFLKVGMIISLAFAILAFNWTSSTYENEGIYFEGLLNEPEVGKREVKQHTKNDNDKPEATTSSGTRPSGTPLKKEVVGFRLFPNPAGKVLNVEFQAQPGPLVIRIFTSSGQLAREQQLKLDGSLFHTDIELAQMTPGVYFLNITQAGRHYSKVFSIQ